MPSYHLIIGNGARRSRRFNFQRAKTHVKPKDSIPWKRTKARAPVFMK